MRTLLDIQQELSVSAEAGLPLEAAARSRDKYGTNRLTPLPREPLWKKFVEKFDEPIIKILLAAALLSMFVEIFRGHPDQTPRVPGAPALAGVMLGVFVVALVGMLVLKLGQWVPTLMFGTAIVVFFVGGLVGGLWSIEGLAVMVAVMLATGVAFLSEYKSDREFEVLNAQKESLRVKVIRGGEFHTIPMEDVVVGDQVVLEMGDEIPADGRIVKATELYIDQSLMTGESEPVVKHARPTDETAEGPEQPGCVYRGTQVVDGVGQMTVTEVGDTTYLGQIARRLSAEADEDEGEEAADAAAGTQEKRVKQKLTISKALTPLQLKLTNLAELISKVGYIAAIAIFLALVVMRGLIGYGVPGGVGELWFTEPTLGENLLRSGGALLNYFVYMVIIIVVAVPEGLPMSVTVSLALAMRKMTRANSLVRQLVACETIGSATVICSDKTGTLTQNKMRVVRLFWDGQLFDRGSAGWPAPDREHPVPENGGRPLDWVVLNAAINSTANLEQKDGKLLTVGNSTEGALLQWLHEAGVEYQRVRLLRPPVYQIHFSSERKRMTTVVKQNGRLAVLVKGAPEWVLASSTQYLAADGAARPWTDEARNAVEGALRDSAQQAMRTLAFGYAWLPEDTPETEDGLHARRDALESDLVFVGFVAIRDPLRDDVKDAVMECRRAGIEVKMITGDNVETARAIAYDIGLIEQRDAPINAEGAAVLTSPRFNEMHERYRALKADGDGAADKRQALQDQLANLRVLARARPLDKYKMVELLQDRSEVVGMTGDGTNDAPSLKKADVGLAMGIAGTEVAKEASKIVLLDDAFSTIVKAVNWGRSLYENIQRFIQFQLTINVSALTIAFLGPFFGIRPPFTVLQLLWINVIMDTFAAIALCSEPPRPGVMNQPPKRRDENILTPSMIRTILSTAAFFVVVMLVLLAGMQWGEWFRGDGPMSEEFTGLSVRQVSIFFAVYVFFQVWNQINCRSLTPETSGFHGIFRNPTFLVIVGTIVVVQILITSIPPLAAIFKVAPLGLIDWLIIVAFTASVLVYAEIARRIRLATEKAAGQTAGRVG